MKTIVMTLVLMASVQTFAREAGGSNLADRIELRNEIRNEVKKSKVKNHCQKADDSADKMTDC